VDEARWERLFEEQTAALQDLRAVIADSAERQERALTLLADHLGAKIDLLGAKIDRLGTAIDRLSVDVRDLRRTWRGGNGPSPEPA
jgi:hypothetical protein